MSDSLGSCDSDDTEILLLISPNYYLNTAEKRLAEEEQQSHNSSDCRTDSKSIESFQGIPPATTTHELLRSAKRMEADANESLHTLHGLISHSAATSYQQLTAGCNDYKSDMNCFNASNAETYDGGLRPLLNFDNLSDLSMTASADINASNTINFNASSTNSKVKGGENYNFVHSTPKASIRNTNINPNVNRYNGQYDHYTDLDPVTLLEIDKFLSGDRANPSNATATCTNPRRSLQYQQHHLNQQNFNSVNAIDQQTSLNGNRQSFENDNLISLSEIWGDKAQIATTVKEEQLRRQHLEKIVRQLLTRQLEYQQRLSVAIEVDKSKDCVLKNLQLQNTSLRDELEEQRQRLQNLDLQHRHVEDNMEIMRKELLRMNALNAKYEEMNKKLQEELNECKRKSADSDQKYRQQIEDLEMQIHASKRSEELAITDMHKNKEKFIKSEHLFEKMKTRCQLLEKENETLQQQKQTLQQLHQKQKTRSDSLEAQKKTLQETVERLTEAETSLKKKMDLQQKTLKSQYQHQLENVVAQKLKEFQEQLDRNEETFKLEAKDRERWIVERSIKQLEQINEKNELELSLLQAKYNEEVQLYRLQLANATKKIEDLDIKVNMYKTKRADIAEKLHNVMETQWRKALEILTAPAQCNDGSNANNTSIKEKEREREKEKENTTKIIRKSNSESTLNNKEAFQQLSTVDKLQAYIEALLSKSPSDFDRLDEMLALNAKAKLAKEKSERNNKRQNHNNKPPWKA